MLPKSVGELLGIGGPTAPSIGRGGNPSQPQPMPVRGGPMLPANPQLPQRPGSPFSNWLDWRHPKGGF